MNKIRTTNGSIGLSKVNGKLENSVFLRIIGAVALLLVGSYLFATGLSNAVLLPLAVAIAGLSGTQAQAQVQVLQNQIILQLAFGMICLAGSLLVAFFKIEALRPYIPQLSIPQSPTSQLSKPSVLTTEELIAELKQRMPRT
jgi:hypothetical protein